MHRSGPLSVAAASGDPLRVARHVSYQGPFQAAPPTRHTSGRSLLHLRSRKTKSRWEAPLSGKGIEGYVFSNSIGGLQG